MTILSQYSLEGALHFFSSQNCLKTLKEFHFGMSSELVYVLYLITVQLHLIFNQKKKKKVSCSINHLIHQTWLWVIFGCFQKWNTPSKLKDLCYRSSWRNVTWTPQNSRGVPDTFWYWKKKFKSRYFAVQPHTFSYSLLFHCVRNETLIRMKYSKCIHQRIVLHLGIYNKISVSTTSVGE